MGADWSSLEAEIDYSFRNREFLVRALTHKSRTAEHTSEPSADNEQLEFLGDSILGFLVSESLVCLFPGYREGRLSKLKAHLVSSLHLQEVGSYLRLGEYLVLGRGEEMSGGRSKKALVANACEAMIAAIYLDGGLEAARAFVQRHVIRDFDRNALDGRAPLSDHKSELQELCQALKLAPPRYTTVNEQGPEHAKTFTVEARIGKEWVCRAEGASKKSAGQQAARLLLDWLRQAPERIDSASGGRTEL
ncbi:MAG TPA: ribonuclease III [Solibacterales bacterium]|nr:ribonuclease III [Bryobacterales bacterium]